MINRCWSSKGAIMFPSLSRVFSVEEQVMCYAERRGGWERTMRQNQPCLSWMRYLRGCMCDKYCGRASYLYYALAKSTRKHLFKRTRKKMPSTHSREAQSLHRAESRSLWCSQFRSLKLCFLYSVSHLPRVSNIIGKLQSDLFWSPGRAERVPFVFLFIFITTHPLKKCPQGTCLPHARRSLSPSSFSLCRTWLAQPLRTLERDSERPHSTSI